MMNAGTNCTLDLLSYRYITRSTYVGKLMAGRWARRARRFEKNQDNSNSMEVMHKHSVPGGLLFL